MDRIDSCKTRKQRAGLDRTKSRRTEAGRAGLVSSRDADLFSPHHRHGVFPFISSMSACEEDGSPIHSRPHSHPAKIRLHRPPPLPLSSLFVGERRRRSRRRGRDRPQRRCSFLNLPPSPGFTVPIPSLSVRLLLYCRKLCFFILKYSSFCAFLVSSGI